VIIKKLVLAGLRRLQTRMHLLGKREFLRYGSDLHIGKDSRLWAPKLLQIGNHVYIGKQVHIEANCEIGDYCLIANRVAIIGRHDHDFSAIGFPVRYAPWVGSHRFTSSFLDEKAIIESDVWLGYGVIVLTGVIVGRGSIVSAGSVVTKSIPPYSIAAGVPARVIGQRFAEISAIKTHEAAIKNGRFNFSERGYDDCLIEPAFNNMEQRK
jgi:acetyltransferase-like isoleucine patch superfamily enzyme